MELKPGNVQDLIHTGLYERDRSSAEPFLHQMLQAIDYLTMKDVIHRDIKPEKILYSPTPECGYLYQLADFGLANLAANAQTRAGSPLYMAPELQLNTRLPQTTKIDVWSLFVTLVYMMNVDGFREKSKTLFTPDQRINTILNIANRRGEFRWLKDMAIEDPSQRASAGDMIDRVFTGEGRVTPRNHVFASPTPQPNPSFAMPIVSENKPYEAIYQDMEVSYATRPEEPKMARSSPREAVVTAKGKGANGGIEKQLAGPSAQTPALGRQGLGHRVQKNTRQATSRMPGAFPADQDRPRRNFT